MLKVHNTKKITYEGVNYESNAEAERKLDLKIDQIPYKDRDHAWYIAFGPYRNPRYAVSVLVEHGGSGSKVAAPIAKKLFKLIINRHELREQIKSKNKMNI